MNAEINFIADIMDEQSIHVTNEDDTLDYSSCTNATICFLKGAKWTGVAQDVHGVISEGDDVLLTSKEGRLEVAFLGEGLGGEKLYPWNQPLSGHLDVQQLSCCRRPLTLRFCINVITWVRNAFAEAGGPPLSIWKQ